MNGNTSTTDATPVIETVRSNAPALAWLTQRPNLPTPRGFQIGGIDTQPNITLFVNTAEQVQSWADAMGVDLRTSAHKGKTHVSAVTFDPFYIAVTAIIDPEAVTA